MKQVNVSVSPQDFPVLSQRLTSKTIQNTKRKIKIRTRLQVRSQTTNLPFFVGLSNKPFKNCLFSVFHVCACFNLTTDGVKLYQTHSEIYVTVACLSLLHKINNNRIIQPETVSPMSAKRFCTLKW